MTTDPKTPVDEIAQIIHDEWVRTHDIKDMSLEDLAMISLEDYDGIFSAAEKIATLRDASSAEAMKERVRHVKRGTEYEVIGEAEAQIGDRQGESDRFGKWRGLYEGNKLTVYRCVETGKLWCRFPDEFRDGRFQPLPPPPAEPSRDAQEGERS